MQIQKLFLADVTRDIPPVVYFHDQSPEKLADEVNEYIITGGWQPEHPNYKRVPNGIHEQYVRLLTAITAELDKRPGSGLPTAWISGFYGSGKSSFAKLLGLALDGVELPDGRSLADAWLERDRSQKKHELAAAWHALRCKINPIAVVFDVGSYARDNEHVHSVAVRELQKRLGYCTAESVGDFELKLERDGLYGEFLEVAEAELDKPWDEAKTGAMADEDFSYVLSKLDSKRYTSPMSWLTSHVGKSGTGRSPDDAVNDIRDMLAFRRPKATLFMVVDEVSQYVHDNRDRQDRLRAFASALGATLKGKAWLLALGQQKLDEEAGESTLIWARDRFPPHLRVDLAPTNIRDVVHQRLLQKTTEGAKQLRAMFDENRPNLKLYAYRCVDISPDEFIDVYPMLPGHIDLLLKITSALRSRSSRSQGDDQAIRGLLQLLGELFRERKLAELPVGALVTIDMIYEIQHTALDSDTQSSMARILNECANEADELVIRAAKAVAMLELIQENEPTTAELVAQCLYDRVDRGNQVAQVTNALERLRVKNLLGHSEKQGYKIQSTAGEEWERTKRDINISPEGISERVVETLRHLLGNVEKPKLRDRPFSIAAVFSDNRQKQNEKVADPRDDAAVLVDFRFLPAEDRNESYWCNRTKSEPLFRDRLVWVCGEMSEATEKARELARSEAMVEKFGKRRDSLTAGKKQMLLSEEGRAEELKDELAKSVWEAWRTGKFYFQGESHRVTAGSFAATLTKATNTILASLFPHFDPITVAPTEMEQLLESDLNGPSAKFLAGQLGILELDSGRYVPACSGVIPRRIQEFIEHEGGISGAALLQHFGRPPYGYGPGVIKACVAGLLRGAKVEIQAPDVTEKITAIRDAGAMDIFTKDRDFKRADFFQAAEDDIGFPVRARICRLFNEQLKVDIDGEDHAIADTVVAHFQPIARRLRDVLSLFVALPGNREQPSELAKLQSAIEACLRNPRQSKTTVVAVKRNFDALSDGLKLLNLFEVELNSENVQAVRKLAEIEQYQVAQLTEIGLLDGEVAAAAQRITDQLASDRPWREVAGCDSDIKTVLEVYREARSSILNQQIAELEAAVGRVKLRPDFSKLSADRSHSVLRVLDAVQADTTDDAVAPDLLTLRDTFTARLQRAEEQANQKLDEILSEGPAKKLVRRVPIELHNRELETEADIDKLLVELRVRLIEELKAGGRIRIV